MPHDEKNPQIEYYKQEMTKKEQIPGTDLYIRAGISDSEVYGWEDYQAALLTKKFILTQLGQNKTVTLGRHSLKPVDPSIERNWDRLSGTHARIALSKDTAVVEDLKSSNGTLVRYGENNNYHVLRGETEHIKKYPITVAIPIVGGDIEDCFIFEISMKTEKLKHEESGHAQIASPEHRNNCEDVFIDSPELGLYGCFDGVSGKSDDTGKTMLMHNGNIAARTAANYATQVFAKEKPQSVEEAVYLMDMAIIHGSKEVFKKSKQAPEYRDMACTASIMYVHNEHDKKTAIIGNIGDSRIYRYRNGNMKQLTVDHNHLYDYAVERQWEAADLMWLQKEISNAKSIEDIKRIAASERMATFDEPLSENELITFWRKEASIIYASMGQEKELTRSAYTADIQEGDIFVIVTDGITGIRDNLTEAEVLKHVHYNRNSSATAISNILVQEAVKRAQEDTERSKSDDTTAVVVKM